MYSDYPFDIFKLVQHSKKVLADGTLRNICSLEYEYVVCRNRNPLLSVPIHDLKHNIKQE
jgi:hypothetical protein